MNSMLCVSHCIQTEGKYWNNGKLGKGKTNKQTKQNKTKTLNLNQIKPNQKQYQKSHPARSRPLSVKLNSANQKEVFHLCNTEWRL